MRLVALPLAALLLGPALAAPGAADLERASTRAAGVVDGVLRDCPAGFDKIGTPQKKCVGASGTVEGVRVKLNAALEGDLYGVWRSRDGQRSVYNWLKTPGGYVYLRVQPDPEGRAQTLLYLDTPPESAGGAAPSGPASTGAAQATPPTSGVTVTRPAPTAPANSTPAAPPPRTAAAGTAPASSPAPARPAPGASASAPNTGAAPAGRNLAPLEFRRVLQVQAPRLSGADVEAVQNRLIALTRPSGGGRGDGWYGPVTAATVRAFQAANGLPVTGRVDRTTWARLFSEGARPFPASAIRVP